MKRASILGISSILCLILAGYNTGFISSSLSSDGGEEMQAGELINRKPPSQGDEFRLIKEQVKKRAEAVQPIEPAFIEIPKLKVNAAIEAVGILENGQMGVPGDIQQVGWFQPGVMPGEKGNAVLAGHVDSKTGPAVFFNLGHLEKDDEIMVKDQKGKTLTFIVQKKESFPRSDAPIQEIFGPSDQKSLNVITCSGTFNRAEGTHEERLVVFTVLKENKLELFPKSPQNVQIQGSFLTWHAVRDEEIAGYRIYRGDSAENFSHIKSISAHERKSFTIENLDSSVYYVTAVDVYGNESEPSQAVLTNENSP
ncbi:class F sortase [Metabacillus lacus]|uniref:class F sortase n=1 Tax=Metabacillus lacus TaxID=1983721 RepID=UPI001BA4F8D5|nr:sortase [Metabacillus lacus]